MDTKSNVFTLSLFHKCFAILLHPRLYFRSAGSILVERLDLLDCTPLTSANGGSCFVELWCGEEMNKNAFIQLKLGAYLDGVFGERFDVLLFGGQEEPHHKPSHFHCCGTRLMQ